MLTRRVLTAFTALAFLSSLSAFAADAPYLTARQLNLVPFLPTPVANGSAEDKAQQALVIAVQKAATPERIALANSDVDESVYAMFASVLGPDFKPTSLPLVTTLFERTGATEDALVDPVKAYFRRTRPYMNNPDIKALVKPSKSGSYPSGHTTRSTMAAILLSSMLPEKRAALFERADAYAQSRVVGGMHYPNDIDGGRRAGTAIAATLLGSPSFIADLDAATVELRKVLGL